MSVALRKSMTLAEFLDWEEQQEYKYEFDGHQVVAMAGGTRTHAALQRNLAIFVGGRLLDGRCTFYGSDLKIQASGSIRYPDGFVVCAPGAGSDKVEYQPVVIFEVLSPSTSATDRIVKNREYAATPSVERYVILEQDRIAATVFARSGADWSGHLLMEDATLDLPEIGLTLPLAELYRGISFENVDSDVQP